MFLNRMVRYSLIGVFGVAGSLAAWQIGARFLSTSSDVQELSEDELWHDLNYLAGEMLLQARRVSTGRILINRGLTDDFEHPSNQGETVSQQQLIRLSSGAYATTMENDPPAPFTSWTEYNQVMSFLDMEERGLSDEEKLSEILGNNQEGAPPPSGLNGLLNAIKGKWGSKKSSLDEAGDYAFDTTLERYADYFDRNLESLGDNLKCCVESHLNEVRKGLTYSQFKAGLSRPRLNPSYVLKPEEKGRLVVILTECIPPGADRLDRSATKQVLDAFGNAVNKAGKFLYECTEVVLDAEKGAEFVVGRAKEIVVDFGVEQAQQLFSGKTDGGGADESGGGATPQRSSGGNPTPRSRSPLGQKAHAVVILNPREADLPIQCAALRVNDGKLIVPRPFAGNYDIYLYFDGIRPVLIRGVEVKEDEEKALSVRGLKALRPSVRKMDPRATVHPSPDTPPEAPEVAPPADCPCKPYRIRITMDMQCVPTGVPPRYSRLRFEGEGLFDLYESDLDFSTNRATRRIGPVTIPMRSERQFFRGTVEGAEFAYSPAEALMRGELSIVLELSREGDGVCLVLLDEIGRNQSIQLSHTVRDLQSGHVLPGTFEERMFTPGLTYPLDMMSKHGCGLPGRVLIRSGSSQLPAELQTGCTSTSEVVIEPVPHE